MSLVLTLLACAATPQPAAEGPTDDDTSDGGAAAAAVEDLTVTLQPPDEGYQLVTAPAEVPAYTEVEICSVLRLEPRDGELLLWANRLESLISSGSHHMNVLIGEFSFLDAFVGEGASEAALGAELGQYPCDELSTMERAFPVFPSQREDQQITMPAGVAAPMTVPLLLVFDHHYYNTADHPVRINAALNIETIPAADVDSVASLVFDDIGDIEVPPGSREIVSRTCLTDRAVEVALVSTHNHQWGECATLNRYDGGKDIVDATPFYVNKRWDQPPILHFEPGSFRLDAGDGVQWACHYINDTEQSLVNDGTADGEMCVIAAVTWPATWTVQEVEDVVNSGDLAGLMTLAGDAMGPCDQTRQDLPTPWDDLDNQTSACDDLEQTESNSL